MMEINHETAIRRLKELGPLLKGWHESRGSNFVSVREQLRAELQDAEETLQELVHVVKPEKRVRLTMTTEFLGALTVNSEADDIISEYGLELRLINPLELDIARKGLTRMPNTAGFEVARHTLYVGQPSFLLRIDRVAQIISEHGTLDIVDSQTPPDEASIQL